MELSRCHLKCTSRRLENIEEEAPASWLPVSCAPPETPTESMEFLSRSWSLSAIELSKALNKTNIGSNVVDSVSFCSLSEHLHNTSSTDQFSAEKVSRESEPLHQRLPCSGSPPISPRETEETKELFLLHQALNPDFLSSQQMLNNGLYKSVVRGKMVGRWLKDQKEKKKQEIRTHKAQLHAAVSVAGVAAAVAAITASTAASSDMLATQRNGPSKTSVTVASAAALVASHCVEIAEEMGADHSQILTVINSAVKLRTTGDIMTLTAGAATALRGAATLKARLQKGYQTASLAPADENVEEDKETDILSALDFVFRGGELLKRTRKGALHWKQVYFYINSNWQVIAKMKSKHMVGTFMKKKKCVVSDVYCNIPVWPGREREESNDQKAYFGIKTVDRLIEFECRSKCDKQMWTDGIQQMLHCRNMT